MLVILSIIFEVIIIALFTANIILQRRLEKQNLSLKEHVKDFNLAVEGLKEPMNILKRIFNIP